MIRTRDERRARRQTQALRSKLRQAVTRGYDTPRPGDLVIDDWVVEFNASHLGGVGQMIRREATVRVAPNHEQMLLLRDATYEGTAICWDGIRWKLVGISYTDGQRALEADLQLTAFVSRGF